MAHQELYLPNRMFTIDLHSVATQEAARIIRTRIKECYRFGLYSLRVVYGSPDSFEGSIIERVCEIVQSDEHVITSELPDWVFAAREQRTWPIFLVVPIRNNRAPELTSDFTSFQKFQARDETTPSQRLLCSMPFQPFRRIYDWSYAARAIGKPCTTADLSSMCSQLGIGNRETAGLTLRELMRAADLYGSWVRQPRAVPTNTEIPPQTNVPIVEAVADSASVMEPVRVPPAPSASDLFRLMDKLLEAGEYSSCFKILNDLENVCEAETDQLEFAFRKGRLLLRMHDASCETWLLKADKACIDHYGEGSPRRRKIIGMLQDWYLSTGESSRVIEYSEIAHTHFGSDVRWSRKRQFQNALVIAAMMRLSGNLLESGRTLTNAAWKYAFQKEGDAPFGFGFEDMFTSDMPPQMQARFFHLVALNATDRQGGKSALEAIAAAEAMAQKCPDDPSLAARIKVEYGRICRRFANHTKKALEIYDEAEALNNRDQAPDIYTRFLINLNRGVALSNDGELRQARKAYARAEEDATEVFGEDHPELFKLLFNQASLYLRRKDYDEAIEKSSRAAGILELMSPERKADIGLAHLLSGQAYNGLYKFEDALKCLNEAERYFRQVPNEIREDHLQNLSYQLGIAGQGVSGKLGLFR